MKDNNAASTTTKISGLDKHWKMYRKWKIDQTKRTEDDLSFLFESNN